MTYEAKNKLLNFIGDWAIDAKVIEAIKSTLPSFHRFNETQGQEGLEELALLDLVNEPLKEIYTAPVFSDAFVKVINDEIAHIKEMQGFEPNGDEDELRQIPEFVLQEHAPELFNGLMGVVSSVLNPYFLSIWGRMAVSGGIQLANYSPKEKKKGAWHHDFSSDFTVVVPLNTGGYVGGGTEFYRRGIVEPLPNGHALMFPAATHMHRGLEVLEGDRYLLVFWLNIQKD